MNKVTYLFIDDEESNRTTAANLKSKILEIDFHIVEENWEKQLNFLLNKSDDFDGLLLDWQLQGEETENGYDAEALAQQIRRLASEKKLKKDFPIILCSAADNYNDVFSRDLTGHDLFDLTFTKNDFGEEDRVPKIRKKFFALAKDYMKLKERDLSLSTVLGENILDSDRIEPRLTSILEKKLKEGIPHEIARFVINEMLEKNGILINEEVLAVRLGIDSKKSNGWSNLLDRLDEYSYKGLFYLGWRRWWMPDIDRWWKSKFPSMSLRRTSPSVKTKHINELLSLSLHPIEYKSRKHKSDFFWTVCAETKVPIDTTDGLILADQENLYPWQDKKYISIDAATNPNIELSCPVAIFEESRLNLLKEKFNVRPRRRR